MVAALVPVSGQLFVHMYELLAHRDRLFRSPAARAMSAYADRGGGAGSGDLLKHECRPGGLTGTVTENVMRVHRKLRLRIIVIWRVSVKIMLIR